MNIPTLDTIVLESLKFFEKTPLPLLNLNKFQLPFVIGSGNALNTGKIIFSQKAAIFGDESNFKSLVQSYRLVLKKGLIKQALVISASGEKDSIWEIKLAQKNHLKTTLLTCKPKSSAAKIADQVLCFKSIAEPYTYNTSTYLGMILSSTKENPGLIKKFIENIRFPKDFSNYQAYTFILADEFANIAPMINIKADELFGPHLVIRAYSQGQVRHAKFVHPWKKELVITIDGKNQYFGHPKHRWSIKTPSKISYGAMMALVYYLVGKIQSIKPKYFEKNIVNFCHDYGPKAYGKKEKFDVIVPANQ